MDLGDLEIVAVFAVLALLYQYFAPRVLNFRVAEDGVQVTNSDVPVYTAPCDHTVKVKRLSYPEMAFAILLGVVFVSNKLWGRWVFILRRGDVLPW